MTKLSLCVSSELQCPYPVLIQKKKSDSRSIAAKPILHTLRTLMFFRELISNLKVTLMQGVVISNLAKLLKDIYIYPSLSSQDVESR